MLNFLGNVIQLYEINTEINTEIFIYFPLVTWYDQFGDNLVEN